MKNLLLSILCLALLQISPVKAQLNPNFTSRLQVVFDSVCNVYNIKGASAAVLVPNIGTWKGVHGISEPGKPITSDMLFGIGSNTKTYTSCIMLKLQEMGKLSLTDTIGKWIHNQPNISGKITIKQILNHTSGIYSFTDNPNFNDSLKANFSRIWTPEESLGFVLAPLFKPGSGWSYSNTNYIIGGIIIKQVMGQPYEVTLRNFILNPQGFNNSIFFPEETSKSPIASQWSVGVNQQNLQPLFSIPDYNNNGIFSFAYSAGAIMQTAEDNVNFWNNLTTGKIINASSLAQMKKVVIIGTGINGGSIGYGLGIFRYFNFFNGHPIYEHGGTNLGYINENAEDTITHICFSVLTNQDSVSNDILLSNVIGALQKVTMHEKLAGVDLTSYEAPEVKLYPNPTTDRLNIKVDAFHEPLTFRLYDISGRELMSQSISDGQASVSIESLSAGMYISRITVPSGGIVAVEKVQIIR